MSDRAEDARLALLNRAAPEIYGPEWPRLLAEDFDYSRFHVLRWRKKESPVPVVVARLLDVYEMLGWKWDEERREVRRPDEGNDKGRATRCQNM